MPKVSISETISVRSVDFKDDETLRLNGAPPGIGKVGDVIDVARVKGGWTFSRNGSIFLEIPSPKPEKASKP